MLYEDYGIYYGELSCEVVENYNKVVCKFLEYGTNHRETICGAPTGNETEASLWDSHERKAAFVNNKYFQTMRHFLVQIFCYSQTLFKKRRNNLTCSVCHERGHMKSSKEDCKRHKEYNPCYGIVYN